jgi:hypothetical protein
MIFLLACVVQVHILEDQNSFLLHKVHFSNLHCLPASACSRCMYWLSECDFTLCQVSHGQQHPMDAAEGSTPTPTLLFGGFFPEVEEQLSTSLQLWPRSSFRTCKASACSPACVCGN